MEKPVEHPRIPYDKPRNTAVNVIGPESTNPDPKLLNALLEKAEKPEVIMTAPEMPPLEAEKLETILAPPKLPETKVKHI